MPVLCRLCGQALFAQPLLVQHEMPAAAQGLPTADQLAADRGVTLALHQCSGCGTVQLATEPVPYWRDVIRAAGISAEMRAYRLDQFGRWLGQHDLTGRKVLEVGCGRGEYLSLLRDAGADATGIEHLPASVAACREAGLRVTEGFIDGPDTRLADGPFDGFAILNFLEHIPAPLAQLVDYALDQHFRGRSTGRDANPGFALEPLLTQILGSIDQISRGIQALGQLTQPIGVGTVRATNH